MGRPSVFEVSDHVYGKPVKPALGLENRVHVQQCLGRVLVGSVSCIYYRYRGDFRSVSRASFERMPHNDEIYVVRHHLYRIIEGLSFGYACVGGVREADYSCSKPVCGRLETQACPGGRLEEDAGHDFPVQKPLGTVGLEFFCDFKDVEYLVLCEVVD